MYQKKKIKDVIVGRIRCEDGSAYQLESGQVALLLSGDTLEVDEKSDRILIRKEFGVSWLKAKKAI